MHVSRSFFASLALHGVIVALAWSAFETLKKTPPEPEKVAISLAAYLPAQTPPPQSPALPKETPPETPRPQSQKPAPAVPSVPRAQPPLSRAVAAPVPAPTPPAPLLPAAAPVLPVAAAVAAPIKAAPPPPPPPPPPEERYEDEHLGQIRAILAERLKYPKNALRLKQQGECLVTFSLGTDKEVSNIVITRTSGFDLLDDAAQALIVSSASEFPKPKKPVRISVPIVYKIR